MKQEHFCTIHRIKHLLSRASLILKSHHLKLLCFHINNMEHVLFTLHKAMEASWRFLTVALSGQGGVNFVDNV